MLPPSSRYLDLLQAIAEVTGRRKYIDYIKRPHGFGKSYVKG
jgi:hypothetical protein